MRRKGGREGGEGEGGEKAGERDGTHPLVSQLSSQGLARRSI